MLFLEQQNAWGMIKNQQPRLGAFQLPSARVVPRRLRRCPIPLGHTHTHPALPVIDFFLPAPTHTMTTKNIKLVVIGDGAVRFLLPPHQLPCVLVSDPAALGR